MCLHGTVLASLSLVQEVVGLRLTFYKKIVNEFTEFSEIHLGKTLIEFYQSYLKMEFKEQFHSAALAHFLMKQYFFGYNAKMRKTFHIMSSLQILGGANCS